MAGPTASVDGRTKNRPKVAEYKPPGKSKKCKGCKRTRLIKHYGKHHMTADRLNPHCRECVGAYLKGRPKKKQPSNGAPTNGVKARKGEKVCKDCKTPKPLDQFGAHHRTADGKNTRCLECYSVLMRNNSANAKEWAMGNGIPKGHKRCRGCKEIKPLDDYAASKSYGGRRAKCLACEGGASKGNENGLVRPTSRRVSRRDAASVVDGMINGEHKRDKRRALTKALLDECGVLKFEADPTTGRVRYAIVEEDYIDMEG